MTLLWSVIPSEWVFMDAASDRPSRFREVTLEGATMVVEPVEGGMARIERVISGNPKHYLKPEWQPGCLIQLPSGQRG
ncbi:hypothetical protein GCM10025857_02770 [Alicyclobacillus contaminans]|uniref:YlzJ-like family protein n=1 Tax=Alicyclobacillus contaminans TaxID=392016 RepID=UPI00040A1748|nr:YlzJ-like family protein [Alicyclobacillus contaminans]GMA48920.1 hypothetical protein GCM10025857_02770 [Alicyclobacillus contaminans]